MLGEELIDRFPPWYESDIRGSRDKTETCHRARFRVHVANKKSEYASAKSQKHNGGDEGHALPHDEMAPKKG